VSMFRRPAPCAEPSNTPPRRHQDTPVLLPTIWGHCQWVWSGDEIGRKVRNQGFFLPEKEILAELRLLGNDAHLVDIGANVGVVSAAALAFGHTVTSVEADPYNAGLLNATMVLNKWADSGRWQLVKHAIVGNARAEPSVHFAWGKGGGSRISRNARNGGRVDTTTLDAVLRQSVPRHVRASAAPLVLKIDIEGCELGAMRGGRQMLARATTVFTEISPNAMRACGGNASEYADWLLTAGFTANRPVATLHREIENALRKHALMDVTFRRPVGWLDGLVRGVRARTLRRPPLR